MPIVGIPVFGDQPDNVMKAVHRGLGLMVPPGTITAASLQKAVEAVIDGRGGYAAAAARVSVRMRAHRVSPAQRAAGELALCCGWLSASLAFLSASVSTGTQRAVVG